MEKAKTKLEIYERDPFGSTCCGPGPMVSSGAAEKLRSLLERRSELVKTLAEEYKDSVIISRDTLSQRRSDYPAHVMKLLSDSKPVPYVFINEEPVVVGRFPSYEEFKVMLKAHARTGKIRQMGKT